jgi:hypothetical protein
MQHFYSYLGSPLHLIFEENIADGYNRTIDAFMAAQKKFKEEYGIQWTPDLPLELHVADEDLASYHKVGEVINLLCKINGDGIEVTEEMCTSDHLVRL